jgi:polyisoprenoid-binding protein YceI
VARYEIDPSRSVAWIGARSSLHPIHSENPGLEGFFEAELRDEGGLELSAPVAGHVELPLERLRSGNPLYDREMKRRVDAKRHPVVAGDLKSMKRAATDGRYLVEGDITFRGVTRPYQGEMGISVDAGTSIFLEGEYVFDVRDFDMEPPRIMMLKVYPDVSVRVRIVATRVD